MGLGTAPSYHGRLRARGRRGPRWIVVAIVATGMLGLTVAFGSTFLQVYRLEREAARLQQVQRDLEDQNALLREEIKQLHTPQYIEKLAREQLGLVKPGETALLIIQTPTDPPPPRPPRPPTGWAGQIWDTLRHLFDR